MSIDLSKFRDQAVSSISIKGKINEKILDIKGRKINFLDSIEYDGEIYRAGDDKFVYLNIFYKYEEACGRCLEYFTEEAETPLKARLVIRSDGVTMDKNEDIIYYTGEELDLEHYIINTIILSIPMKPLCDKDCKGLCPTCGINYNQTKCDCATENIDPRFEKLKDFFPGK